MGLKTRGRPRRLLMVRGIIMKKKTGVVAAVVLTVAVLGAAAYVAMDSEESALFAIGRYFSSAKNANSTTVAATYKEHEILISEIEYNRNVNAVTGKDSAKSYGTDKEIADRIIENLIMVEEAQRRGLAATEEEIESMMDSVRESYEIPAGKEIVDQYCQGAGITLEQYYENVRGQLPGIIARLKLKEAVGREYCAETGIEYTNVNPPPEMKEAQDQYVAELLEAHKDDIVYFVK